MRGPLFDTIRAMRTIEEFLVYFRRQRSWTRSLVAAAPEACFDWRPAPDAFSCGELVRHLIQSEAFWRRLLLAAAAGQRYDPFGLTGTAMQRMTAFRKPNLESSRGDGAKYGASFAACLESWRGVQAKTVQIISHEHFEYSFKQQCHLLVAVEQGVRYDGETFVEGLPKSTIRNYSHKLVFVPAGRKFFGVQRPRLLTRSISDSAQ